MVDHTEIETEDGFNDDSILDFACSMVEEECPHMTVKGNETSTMAEQMAFLHPITIDTAQGSGQWILDDIPRIDVVEHLKASSEVDCNNDGHLHK